ncbi:MAG: type II toxin-antitoxin system Phd/YefM family antitoxin [Proteobacteria bacterium]|nr:type II toxin-antitoxin system Phd/YefM family antitoxin [Pseudomonadota bacterium]
MSIETTYTDARARLAELCDTVVDEREVVIINRRNHPKVALISADELQSLTETAHLLRSPRNAARLLTALQRALDRQQPATSIEELRRDIGLVEDP